MDCDRCGREAVIHAAYSGLHMCESHFLESVEKRVRQRVREDKLLPDDATPENPETRVVGLSGGKDSAVLATILHDVFVVDPRVELVALSIHEGIEGYRDESLAACRELAAHLDVRHEVVTYEEEFGVRMDEVVEDDPENMSACAYCGVFRRDILARRAAALGADKLLTGHNLDDEAETALMNFLSGDITQITKHFDASFGGFDGGRGERTRGETRAFVPRAKPVRDVPEKEVALYAHLRDLPAHITECPHAEEAYRGEDPGVAVQTGGAPPRHRALDYGRLRGTRGPGGRGTPRRGRRVRRVRAVRRADTGDVCRKCDLLEALA